jgi:GAF domain-containing protein
MVWVGMLDDDTQRVEPVAQWGHDDGYVAGLRITTRQTKDGIGPTGRAMRENRPVINQDFRIGPHTLPWRHEALRRMYLSSAAFPLMVSGRAAGSLNLYSGEPHYFTAARVSILERFAARLGSAVETARQSTQ